MPGVKGKSGRKRQIKPSNKLTKMEKASKKMKQLINQCTRKQKSRAKNFCSETARSVEPTYHNDIDKSNVIFGFENETSILKHSKCICCRMVRLDLKINKRGICRKCAPLKNEKFYLQVDALPVWYNDEGIPQYYVPSVLSSLTQAEKLLVQRISPFVPLQHLKQGTFGLSGHVCAFEQDVNEFLTRLPRQRDDVSMIRVLRTVQTEIGGSGGATVKAFRIRKKAVLLALRFLKKYNPEYHDIIIDMSSLDWIDGDEGVLDGQVIGEGNVLTLLDDTPQNADMGPAPRQAIQPRKEGDDIGSFGYLDVGAKAPLPEHDQAINDALQEVVDNSPHKRNITVDWPATSSLPVNEYDGKKIFALAFPWLFPGGIGDVKDFPGKEPEWGKNLLFYEDGRFAKDKVFCFFALNYIIRKRNHSSGKWFIDKFQEDCPDTLEELKESVEKGNTAFINKLTYYSKRIKGTSSYWFQKRSELYSWINHHIEAGNGAPLYFMTLSCAEHFWPDVIDLMHDRLRLANLDTSECYVGSPKLPQFVNDYTVVIQEYFQRRVEIWLQTVGKKLFGVKHFWVRYEFAPGRGQIHAHLLAIPDKQTFTELCNAQSCNSSEGGVDPRAEALAKWAEARFGLTASVENGFDDLDVDKTNTPVRIRFSDVENNRKARVEDCQKLMKYCQEHECSEFCLKRANDKR